MNANHKLSRRTRGYTGAGHAMGNTTAILAGLILVTGLMAGLAGCQSLVGGPEVGYAAIGGDLPLIPDGVVSRAITEENRSGARGAGGMASDAKLGPGRKGAPCIRDLQNGETATLMDVEGCGVIRHIWITINDRSPEALRNLILRMYWDGSEVPSVEVPFGDFFGTAHGRVVDFNSAYVSVPLARGFNCYFPMPFGTRARVTLHNDLPDGKPMRLVFYQIDYELRDRLPANTGRFHAQFRRQNPTVLKQDFVLLDGAEGPGMFIGCVIGVRPLGPRWWGEGEMKFYMDGDTDYPTICGTGTEDYFCAAWGMGEYHKPYFGCSLYLDAKKFPPHGLVSMYRWHEKDPVYFRKSFRAEMQQIGWGDDGLFERSDDWCSVAYWYQLKPISRIPALPDRAARTVDLQEPPAPPANP